MQKQLSFSLTILLLFGAYFLGFQNGSFSSSFSKNSILEIPISSESKNTEDPNLDLFWNVWTTAKDRFVDVEKLDSQKMLYGAMKGVIHSLGDPHSEFFNPEESEEFLDSLEGSLTGIGAEVGIRDDLLVIVSPLRGSPAEAAGLLPGDHIFKIDNEIANDYSLFEAVKHIRGELGTDVVLTIFREDEMEPREITITRDFIDIKSVDFEIRDDGIAVVVVSTFAEDTATEFSKILADLAIQNPSGIILDLRFNGGGFLDAAIEMTSNLLSSGDVVIIHERGYSDEIISVSGAALLPETPLVILINGGSASASEILAGALQDADRATILGEKSFGKGTVQELIDFPNNSTLRITVAKWLTPSGRDINELGIEPDFQVKMTAEDYLTGDDLQLNAAVEFLQTGNVETTSEES